jgi:hypothetical protein
VSTGPADLSKFPSIDPRILFAALDMPFYLVNPERARATARAIGFPGFLASGVLLVWNLLPRALPSEK